MGLNDSASLAASRLLRSETRPRMVKADLRKTEKADLWRFIGPVVERTRLLCRRPAPDPAGGCLSLKEFADALGRDERQVRAWIDGTERPQLEVIYAVAQFRAPLVIALAEHAQGIEVETTISIRRIA